MATTAGPVGGLSAKDEITEVEMEIMEPPEEVAERAGMKRAWGSANASGSHGFIGVTTAEKKPTLLPHNNVKYLKKAGNGNLLHPDIDGAHKTGGLYLHGTHRSPTLPYSNASRFSSSSPGGDLGSKTKTPTGTCTFNAQGQCKKGKNCTFPHEREGSGFGNLRSEEEKAGSLASVGYGKHRGSEEGSEAQGVSNFENFVASSKHGLYRTLIHSYGEDPRGLAHNSSSLNISEERSRRTDNLWTTKPPPPVNELVKIPVVQEKNHEPCFVGRHVSLPSDSYVDARGTLPRLHLDGGRPLLDLDVAKASSLSDSHVSDHRYRPFDSSVSFDYHSEKLSAYGGPTENLPHKYQKEHSSSLASYSSNSITGFRNPGHNSSAHSLGSQPFQGTTHLGMPPLQQLTPVIQKVGLHKDVYFDKDCGTSRPGLLASSSRQSGHLSPGHLSPIKDDAWINSVPFVPLLGFPDSSSLSNGPYDPLVDSMDHPKVESINILKSSNISCSISSQHTSGNGVIDGDTNKLLKYEDKLARNMSAKGSNEFAGLVAPDKEHCSLDGDTLVKAFEIIKDEAINEKMRDFRFHLAEHVKELLKPIWKEGNLSKDAYKLIVKKSVDKVLASVELHQLPATKELITDYITMAGTKIEKLVKAYVVKHRTG